MSRAPSVWGAVPVHCMRGTVVIVPCLSYCVIIFNMLILICVCTTVPETNSSTFIVWVNKSVSDSDSLSQNDAEKVVVVIMDKEHHPVERFVFEISQPPLLSIRSVLDEIFMSL